MGMRVGRLGAWAGGNENESLRPTGPGGATRTVQGCVGKRGVVRRAELGGS